MMCACVRVLVVVRGGGGKRIHGTHSLLAAPAQCWSQRRKHRPPQRQHNMELNTHKHKHAANKGDGRGGGGDVCALPHLICAHVPHQLEVALRGGGDHEGRAVVLRDLDASQPSARGATQDQYPGSTGHLPELNQCLRVCGRGCVWCGEGEGDIGWVGGGGGRRGRDERGVRSTPKLWCEDHGLPSLKL